MFCARKSVLVLVLLASLLWAGLSRLARGANPNASNPERCELCQGVFTNGIIHKYKDRVRQVKRGLCEACSELKTKCWACDIPARPRTLLRLADGRVLCEQDTRLAMLSEEQARDMFLQVKRDLQPLLAHWLPLPDTNISVHLVNQDDFIREFRRKPVLEDPENLLGLTRSEPVDTNEHTHFVYLLSGVPRAQFAAVCAHEYTHVWLNEHDSKERVLSRDTEEGFCELMAWKYVTGLRQPIEAERILQSTYTHGQVKTLVDAEREFGFYRVVTWILYGVDSWLDKDAPRKLLAVKRETAEPSSSVAFSWAKAVPTTVPDRLILKGITSGKSGRFALINDQTLARGEQGKVRLGSSNVLVKCLEVRERSVLVEVGGGPPLELLLPKGK